MKTKKPILTYEEFVRSYNIKRKQKELVEQWFPLYPSIELAEIAAALLTDGHIDWNDYDGCPRPKKLVLYSDYRNECEWFLNNVYRLLNVKGKVVRYRAATGFTKNNSYKAIVYCAPLARILISVGVPCGDKTQKGYKIPKWVMRGNKDIKQSFLKTLFNFDGSITITDKRSTAAIQFSFNKQKKRIENGKCFLLQIKKLLDGFGVSSGNIHIRKCRQDKYTLMLFITNQKAIINYYKHIGFLNKEKQNRLLKFIYKIYTNARISFKCMPSLLTELKEKIGSDRKVVAKVNMFSRTPFTYRQFEHMRRGEVKIPIQMAIAAIRILDKKEYFKKIPRHYQDVIKIYDEDFP